MDDRLHLLTLDAAEAELAAALEAGDEELVEKMRDLRLRVIAAE